MRPGRAVVEVVQVVDVRVLAAVLHCEHMGLTAIGLEHELGQRRAALVVFWIGLGAGQPSAAHLAHGFDFVTPVAIERNQPLQLL